ncbi:hypothetical protein [Bosea sp. 124]|uniref:hypothetical protein n=1 Tax=Bosea sp. 124 TaxID=2135642 RepID=UPI000D375460|nr:hypothetical protein [Bosea sp. 124]PTM39800.1 hypothetical protein C8D03_1305 [Bosea sp. 124]
MSRSEDLARLYSLLGRLESAGGKRTLESLGTTRDWPRRGVYFFFEAGEERSESGTGPRLVRVGTHALGAGARSTLRQRLRQHGGGSAGGGNHRGSIFRLLVGEALLTRGACPSCLSWGVKGDFGKDAASVNASRTELSASEAPVEFAVSAYLRAMPFLWLSIDDEPGPGSLRGVIERNSIALLSNFDRPPLDPPSDIWLGRLSSRKKVHQSGLWNQNHVGEDYDPAFLDVLDDVISRA